MILPEDIKPGMLYEHETWPLHMWLVLEVKSSLGSDFVEFKEVHIGALSECIPRWIRLPISWLEAYRVVVAGNLL